MYVAIRLNKAAPSTALKDPAASTLLLLVLGDATAPLLTPAVPVAVVGCLVWLDRDLLRCRAPPQAIFHRRPVAATTFVRETATSDDVPARDGW